MIIPHHRIGSDKIHRDTIFIAPAIGLIIGNLGAGMHRRDGGSGFIAPFGIDLALLVGASIGFFQTFGILLTPGVAIGRMGFIVVGIGIHWHQKFGMGIVIPIFPLWAL